MKKALVLMMTLLMAVMMVAGCGGGDKKAPAVQAPKVLKVGTEPTFAPFEFQKEGSKEFDGFDMDLIRAIGKQLNMQCKSCCLTETINAVSYFAGLLPNHFSYSLS